MRPHLSSREWHDHYLRNAASLLPIPWEAGAQLTAEEERAIVASLRAWQLGETSDGRHLVAAAERYATAIADPDFLAAVRLFIREEQRHGEMLGRFLDMHGGGRILRNWGDSVFRWMRYCLPNMEIWTTVVIAVETLALVYYRAILLATENPLLQAICRQILRDEVHHLRFQYERLALICAGRGTCAWWLTLQLQRVLFFGTTLAVWVDHHRALSAGGYSFSQFWHAAWKRMEFHWRCMRQDTASNMTAQNPRDHQPSRRFDDQNRVDQVPTVAPPVRA